MEMIGSCYLYSKMMFSIKIRVIQGIGGINIEIDELGFIIVLFQNLDYYFFIVLNRCGFFVILKNYFDIFFGELIYSSKV